MIGFGTGGWRAVIGEEFTKANVQLLTAALARKMKDEGTQGNGFVIGYDRRFLSVEAAKWAAEVMAGEGIACKLVNREAPTPLIMFAVKYYDMAYGMAVTCLLYTSTQIGIAVVDGKTYYVPFIEDTTKSGIYAPRNGVSTWSALKFITKNPKVNPTDTNEKVVQTNGDFYVDDLSLIHIFLTCVSYFLPAARRRPHGASAAGRFLPISACGT